MRKRKCRLGLFAGLALSALVLVVCQLLWDVPERRLPPVPAGVVELHVLDVGQASCALVRTEYGNVLIDAGDTPTEADVITYLRQAGVETLDCAIFTHPDSDHIGGADDVLRTFEVKRVVFPAVPESLVPETEASRAFLDALDEWCGDVTEAKRGMAWTMGEVSFRILSSGEVKYEDVNNYSVCLRIDFGDTSFLFTGDAFAEVEAELLENCSEDLNCTFFQAGHHGANTSNTEAFVRAVSPEIVAVSCGENSFGHPSGEALWIFDEVGATVFRTDREGALVFVSDGKHIIKE